MARLPDETDWQILLEQKMSYGADDDQADNSAFQEQDEELDNIDGDLGAQDKAAYLRKVNKLGNRNGLQR